MWFIVPLLVPLLLSATMTAIASIWWWRTLAMPWFFTFVALLAMLGLHRVLQFLAELFKVATAGGYILEARPRPDPSQFLRESLSTELLVVCLLMLVVGTPLLFGLRAAMAKP